MTFIITLIIIILFIYALIIMAFAFAWKGKQNNANNSVVDNVLVSIIIAVRNEENNIENCIASVLKQTYRNIEIIVIDDHSQDNTYSKITSLSKNNDKIRVYQLPDNLQGKKSALSYGVSNAKGDILFFTDADCVINENHISCMLGFMYENNTDMLCGAVEFTDEKSILSKIFQLEFLSLTGSGAAGIFLKTPFMCNAANYLIKKDIFIKAENQMNDKFSSGDDVFLLHYISGAHKVDFIKNTCCIVKTKAPRNLNEFFNQRIRWSSKAKAYKKPSAIITGATVFFMSLSMIFVYAALIFGNNYSISLFLIILCKILIDISFLFPVLKFHKKTDLLWYIPVLQVFYPFYIVITPVISFFYKPLWKNRHIKA